MSGKRYKLEEIIGKLRQVDKLVSQEKITANAAPQIGVTEASYPTLRT